MTLPLWAAVAIPAACLFGMVAIFAWSLCRAAATPDPETSLDHECDHCDGTGSIYEPAPDDAAHEYDCYGEDIPCANCGGTGRVFADPDPPNPVEPGARPRFPAPGSGDGFMQQWDMEASEYFAEWSQ